VVPPVAIERVVNPHRRNKPNAITQGSSTLFFNDDVDHQRYKQIAPEGNTLDHRQHRSTQRFCTAVLGVGSFAPRCCVRCLGGLMAWVGSGVGYRDRRKDKEYQ
jgi:hypothetical protein